jgi:Mn-dependent DtxR family transcriptional regulator
LGGSRVDWKNSKLTPKKIDVFVEMGRAFLVNGYTPFESEIARTLGTSREFVRQTKMVLREKGFLDPKERGLVITPKGWIKWREFKKQREAKFGQKKDD